MAKARHPKRKPAHKVAPHAKARKGGKCPHCGKAHTKSEHWSHAARHGEKWYGRKERPQTATSKSGRKYKKHPKTGEWEKVKGYKVGPHEQRETGGKKHKGGAKKHKGGAKKHPASKKKHPATKKKHPGKKKG